MLDVLEPLFDSSGFTPRWQCGAWAPALGWLHILSDLGVWSAYMAIPAGLGFFVLRRKDVPFRRILILFTAFILACGTTHLMEAVTFWWPAYRLAAALKLATAVISWVTVVALVGVVPRMLAMRAPEELEKEIVARRAAEAELVGANAALERRVRERTEELTRANAALHTERERFRTTLSSIGDAVIATDLAGRVTFLNPVAESQTGWSAQGAVGQDLRTVFHIVNETTRTSVENPAARALREGIVVGLANHTVLIARDGSERPIDDSAAPIRDGTGGVAGAVLVFRDISERRLAEAQIRESEERYRMLFEANPHPMWVYDRETLGFLAVNNAATAKYGYTRDEFLGLTLKDIRPPEDVPALLASIAADTGGLDEAGVWRHRLKDGRVVHVRIVSHTLTFAGRAAEVVLSQDVTDQLRAETALRHSEERFRAFMDHSPAAAWITDADGRVVYHSASYPRTFQLPAGEIVGRPVEDLYPPDLAEAYLRTTRAVAAGGAAATAAASGSAPTARPASSWCTSSRCRGRTAGRRWAGWPLT
ncbi:PAS domain-containing protein [Frigoriglobus tundricola]|uniref:Autoinducer 2 sensor kinase/phosphatase LuxQ n=1 Tax=Frigoriglobus tundricola TaxID=2774151 RepID=A0A6M5YL14_9BACT|nr:PAS domain S-box protein [Frigoriglobus tundricola]QJW94040.1 Autoinducer 2 sensor kinase/phosphatase LuxQ [Frigoriglobus tundricola]